MCCQSFNTDIHEDFVLIINALINHLSKFKRVNEFYHYTNTHPHTLTQKDEYLEDMSNQ